MKLSQNIIEKLRQYVEKNEVVYQVYEELVEISNDQNTDNRKALLDYFNHASSVEVYEKGATYLHEPFEDLDEWATPKDVLFLLETIGVVICVPHQEAIEQELISED